VTFIHKFCYLFIVIAAGAENIVLYQDEGWFVFWNVIMTFSMFCIFKNSRCICVVDHSHDEIIFSQWLHRRKSPETHPDVHTQTTTAQPHRMQIHSRRTFLVPFHLILLRPQQCQHPLLLAGEM
jgi:hypothetical protein